MVTTIRRGHCAMCGGWSAFRGYANLCYSCAILPVEETPKPDTYSVIGCCGRTGREKVVRDGLTYEAADELRKKMARDPLCAGFSLWISRDGVERR